MGTHRAPAVAGLFYPAEATVLARTVADHLDLAEGGEGALPKALIVPHAGYPYSGPVAGRVYGRLRGRGGRLTRVVLLGPAHHRAVPGLAAPSVTAFDGPLGPVPVDQAALARLADLEQVRVDDAAHAPEHCLEVQLPFLQAVLDRFRVVPLLVGQASPEAVAQVLDRLWGGPETLIVVSSDLSHYLPYAEARALDARTALAIEALAPSALGAGQACGRAAVQGLLLAARRHGLQITRVDLRSSGDTAGPRDAVVGYGGWVLGEAWEPVEVFRTDDAE